MFHAAVFWQWFRWKYHTNNHGVRQTAFYCDYFNYFYFCKIYESVTSVTGKSPYAWFYFRQHDMSVCDSKANPCSLIVRYNNEKFNCIWHLLACLKQVINSSHHIHCIPCGVGDSDSFSSNSWGFLLLCVDLKPGPFQHCEKKGLQD